MDRYWRVDSSACQLKAIVCNVLAAISPHHRLLSARHAVLNGAAWAFCGGCVAFVYAVLIIVKWCGLY